MTTKRANKSKQWPPIHELKYASGKRGFQVACMLDGERIRETYSTKGEAETRAAQIRTKVQNEGSAAFNLPLSLRVEAVECATLLKPHGATIREACQWYEKHVLKYRNAPTVSEIVEKLIADAVAAERRGKTTEDLRYRLGVFTKPFGARKLSEITIEELGAWANDSKLSARSRRHMLTKLSQLYRYAERRGWCEKNIAAYIARPDVPDGEPGFLKVEQCARLMECAPDHDLTAYVVLSLFAGIRVAELRRLTWDKVKMEQGVIIIDGSVAKTKARRIIELHETARAWLATCAKRNGPVVDPTNFRKRLDALRKAAGLTNGWPENALRHTAATYTYAFSQDAVRVAAMLGHSVDVLHRNYRGLATKVDAERFFALRPAGAQADIRDVSEMRPSHLAVNFETC